MMSIVDTFYVCLSNFARKSVWTNLAITLFEDFLTNVCDRPSASTVLDRRLNRNSSNFLWLSIILPNFMMFLVNFWLFVTCMVAAFRSCNLQLVSIVSGNYLNQWWTSLLTYICVVQHQWAKWILICTKLWFDIQWWYFSNHFDSLWKL